MVSFGLWISTHAAGHFYKSSGAQCASNGSVRFFLQRVFVVPSLACLCGFRRGCSGLPVSAGFFSVPPALAENKCHVRQPAKVIGMNIRASARLAFIQPSIGHLWMRVELIQRFRLMAFKARLHFNYQGSHCASSGRKRNGMKANGISSPCTSKSGSAGGRGGGVGLLLGCG